MPEKKSVVIDTGPILSIIAAFGSLEVLSKLYKKVLVPLEVCDEILAGGPKSFGITEML